MKFFIWEFFRSNFTLDYPSAVRSLADVLCDADEDLEGIVYGVRFF